MRRDVKGPATFEKKRSSELKKKVQGNETNNGRPKHERTSMMRNFPYTVYTFELCFAFVPWCWLCCLVRKLMVRYASVAVGAYFV